MAAPACVDVPSAEALVIDLDWRGEELWARVHNRSCKALYRSRRCGKELQPTLQVLKPGVSQWQVAACVSGAGDSCAEATSCVRLGPNESYDVRITSLDGCGDCSGTFRAGFLYFDESTCEQRGGKLQIAEDLMLVEQQACP